ncbi:MAG: hypothetical protein PVJ57_08570 [Phycisphaerae bacterium]|jgi:hypothetical protein
MYRALTRFALPTGLVLALSLAAFAQTAQLVEFPDPAKFYQNSSFIIDRNVAFVPTYDNDTLWSFSTVTGELLDPNGLALAGNASDPFLFAGDKLAMPGWFPNQGVFVADISDPANIKEIGVISLPTTTNIQGQEIAVDENGYIGYVAGFPNDTLYSFNVNTLQLEDMDGLVLPGNPDRIALGADYRLAIVDTTNKVIMVVDVADPANLTLIGTITLPGTGSFGSNDVIAIAEDGHTAYIAADNRVLYSFDLATMSVLDPDGVSFGTQGGSYGVVLHGDRAAVPWDRGLTFFDISDPTNLTVVSNAAFGGTVAPQGNGVVSFSQDGTKAIMPVIYPGNYVYSFYVETGAQFATRYEVSAQPNLTAIYGADLIGVLCNSGDNSKIWLIGGLLDGDWAADMNCDGVIDNFDISPFLAALLDPTTYQEDYPLCDPMNADCNDDGEVNNFDIKPFIDLLLG